MDQSFRVARPAAAAAAIALFAHYALHVAHGLQTGNVLWDAMGSPLGRIDGPVFTAFYLGAGTALLGVAAGLGRRQRVLSAVGASLAVFSLAAAVIGGASFLTGHMVPFAMPAATLSQFLGAILLAVASLRSDALPRRTAVVLSLCGLVPIPLGMVLPALGGDLPAWVLFEAHFVGVGALWLMVAAGLRRAEDLPLQVGPV
ncbi:MAG TPA: hypothetical protein VF576_02600 [Rubricoccaceae bacterium]